MNCAPTLQTKTTHEQLPKREIQKRAVDLSEKLLSMAPNLDSCLRANVLCKQVPCQRKKRICKLGSKSMAN